MSNIHIMQHALIAHKTAILRDTATTGKQFRELINELTILIGYEATRDLPLSDVLVKTPLVTAKCKMLESPDVAIIPILRAGLGMVDGMLSLLPSAKVGHLGLARDHETLEPKEYYCNLPKDIANRQVMIVDPMLATGGSAIAAIKLLKSRGVKNIRLLSIIGAPEGIAAMEKTFPDVPVFCGTLDERLNENGYILPGLGDAGDRLFGTL